MDAKDAFNGGLELLGALLVWRSAWQVHLDGEVRGVYWPATGFFTLWGLWNLFYYPALGQWLSFFGGMALVAGNAAWLVLVLRLRFVGWFKFMDWGR